MTEEAGPCGECLNAGELGDGTWICLAFSQHIQTGELYIQMLSEDIDWKNCPKYWSPDEELEEEEEDEEDEDEDEEEE